MERRTTKPAGSVFSLTTNGLHYLRSALLLVASLATVGKQHHRTMFDHPQSIIFFSSAVWQLSVDASYSVRDFLDEKNEDIRLLFSNCCYTGEATETIARVTVMHFSADSLNCIPSAPFSESTLFSSRSGIHYWLGRKKKLTNMATEREKERKKRGYMFCILSHFFRCCSPVFWSAAPAYCEGNFHSTPVLTRPLTRAFFFLSTAPVHSDSCSDPDLPHHHGRKDTQTNLYC